MKGACFDQLFVAVVAMSFKFHTTLRRGARLSPSLSLIQQVWRQISKTLSLIHLFSSGLCNLRTLSTRDG